MKTQDQPPALSAAVAADTYARLAAEGLALARWKGRGE
jgi:hypothetical protein